MKSAFWSFLIHLIVGLVGFLILFLATRGQDTLAANIVADLFNNPEQLEAQRGAVATAAFLAFGVAVTISFLASAVFLLVAGAYRPGQFGKGAQLMGLWFGLLLLALAGATGALWWQLWQSALNFDFNPSRLWTVAAVSQVAVLIAYYLGTAWPVKPECKTSVPFAVLLPRLGSAK